MATRTNKREAKIPAKKTWKYPIGDQRNSIPKSMHPITTTSEAHQVQTSKQAQRETDQ
eukprot:CAMPEP_0172834290 /NCGR_PEP_ID=MMETSP1075-20121228/24948_1 /TAXON_ID=2916 /ORGANISM="Ceratium fusus, Strain PA161109" /LENGTH=57 /DNA_ID=CAMNT_0013677171 /DNA_START=146 /DNA_END=319 /DNA_ORIENTATION=+